MYLANTDYKISLERFLEHYKDGTIETITLDEIPQDAMELFERKSHQFIPQEIYIEKNFEKSFVINHFNYDNYKTHVVIQEKNYSNTSKTIEKSIYLYESNHKNSLRVSYSALKCGV